VGRRHLLDRDVQSGGEGDGISQTNGFHPDSLTDRGHECPPLAGNGQQTIGQSCTN
jgi:hypothetical protein